MFQSIASMVSFSNVIVICSFDLKGHWRWSVLKRSLRCGDKPIIYKDEAQSKRINGRVCWTLSGAAGKLHRRQGPRSIQWQSPTQLAALIAVTFSGTAHVSPRGRKMVYRRNSGCTWRMTNSRVGLSPSQSRQTDRAECATTYVASVGKPARFLSRRTRTCEWPTTS